MHHMDCIIVIKGVLFTGVKHQFSQSQLSKCMLRCIVHFSGYTSIYRKIITNERDSILRNVCLILPVLQVLSVYPGWQAHWKAFDPV